MSKTHKENDLTGFEIAVIGQAGRFPGAKNIEEFWHNLKTGTSSITFFSDQELREEGIAPETLQDPNYIKARGALEGIEYFDHDFFGISYGEADLMDPQLRMLHECSWEALECAGYNPETYQGSIGFYTTRDLNVSWLSKFLTNNKSFAEQLHLLSLNDPSAMSTRISYNLNLKGPSFTVSTACSSSLVAIHVACQALLSYECEMALAGGVGITLPKKSGYPYQKGMVASPDGHCRAFDEQAAGTVPGDGCGIVVLKRLEDALKDGDHIYAVVKGTAINNDGSRKVGYMAPSVEGQAEAIRMAQQMAEVPASSIGYIEAHGTGTVLGDPIEVEGLKLAFNTEQKQYCLIGSVKTNIGHLDAAAGVAGFIKTVLSLKNRLIVPSLNYQKPNPQINFEHSPFKVSEKLTPWTNDTYPLRAGVSSFGIGGTNAHVVLEEYQEVNESTTQPYNIITLSAKTPLALEQMTSNLRDFLTKNSDQNLSDMAYTLQVGRKDFAYRRALVATTIADATQKLQGLTTHLATAEKLVFMFPGQGAQYVNMGRELYENQDLFRAEMDRCFDLLGEDFKEILFPIEADAETRINEIAILSPLLFVIEYALAKLLLSWGLTPTTMIGYSLGEYVAACLCGVFSLEAALKIVTIRGKLLGEVPPGAMISVPLSEANVKPYLNEALSISVVNGDSCIIAGCQEGIKDLEDRLKRDKYLGMRLDSLHIAHSRGVDVILDRFAKELALIQLNKPQYKYISGMTGEQVGDEVSTVDYWARHLRETVRFIRGIEGLLAEGNHTFIEVGPGRDLSILVNRYTDKRPLNTLPPKNKDDFAEKYLFNQIAQLWCRGFSINWHQFNQGWQQKRTPLPTYPFAKTFFDVRVSLNFGGPVPTSKKQMQVTAKQDEILDERGENIKHYQEPTNEIEKALVEIMQAMFKVDLISVDEDFFELGGDSLKATILAGKIHEQLNLELPVHEIFNYPTASGMAKIMMGAEKSLYSPIDVAPIKAYYPLTPQQRGILIADLLGDNKIGYHVSLALKLTGPVQQGKVAAVFSKIIHRHDSLRTAFKTVAGETMAHVTPLVDFKIDYIEAVEAEFPQVKTAFVRPFDLSQAPLFRVALMKITAAEYILLLDTHHIVVDGSSLMMIVNEFTTLYENKELPALKLQYKDYEQWQQELRQSPKYKEQADYWLTLYQDGAPTLNLPTDYARPALKSFAGKTDHFSIGSSLTAKLYELANTYQMTLYMVLLAAYNILLHKYTAGEDIVVGTPFAARTHPDLQDMVGMFVNTIALRNFPHPTLSVEQFLEQVKEKTLKAYENQDYQFEELVKNLNLRKDMSRSPVFDTMFVLQNMELRSPSMSEIEAMIYGVEENHTAKFDLTVNAYEDEDGLKFAFEYSTKLFKPATIVRLKHHFIKIMEAIVCEPTLKISDINMLTANERQQLLYEFNDTLLEYPEDKTIQQLFEEQVVKTPTKVALVYENEALTYSELNQKANQLARVIRQKKVKPDDIIAIMMKRCSDMVIAMLATIKAGGAFVMIDLDYPIERIRYMLQDSSEGILVTKLSESEKINLGYEHELIDVTDSRLYQGEATNLDVVNVATDLLYITYTSGTTGQPKGIMMKHQSMVNLVSFQFKKTMINFHEKVMQFAAMNFDVCYQEVFSTLLQGGALYIIEEHKKKNVKALFDYIARHEINVLFLPTAYFKFISGFTEYISIIPGSLDHLIVAGEQLIVSERVKNHLQEKKICLHNHYGPSESHAATACVLNDFDEIPLIPPIGKPIANTKIYILGANDALQPIGVLGELCIAGVGLARGYLNLPELTKAKFVNHPFNTSELMYRTGDLARWLPDGNIDYLGRLDHQVKIRGFRVEIGEIESRLLELEAVNEAIVIVKENNKEKYLCAYVVGAAELTIEGLRASLAAKLPAYMVPSFFIKLNEMPLTANGKVNRKALPEPQDEAMTAYVAPRNELEERLAQIWCQVLEREKVGIDHNFFDLGGHSLKAMAVVLQVHKELGINLPLEEMFQTPTIAQLAKRLTGLKADVYAAIKPLPAQEYYETSSAQKRMWLLQQFDLGSTGYNIVGVSLIEGELSKTRFEVALSKLVARHEALRTTFVMRDGEIMQKVGDHVDFAIQYSEAIEANISKVIKAFIRPFVLEQLPLLRVALVKVGGDRHFLMFDMHHIIADGTSLAILLREFAVLYGGLELRDQPIQYKEFAHWQNEFLQSEKLLKQEKYWLGQFSGEVPLLNLPLDYPRGAVQSFEGANVNFSLDQELTEKLQTLSQETGATLYMILLSAITILLAKYTRQTDIIVGSPIAGRSHADLEGIIGMFVNTLVMRNYPTNDKSYRQFLSEVKASALKAYENQDYPFEELVDKLNLRRDLSRHPLIDVMFGLQNKEQRELAIEGLTFTEYENVPEPSKFDLTFTAVTAAREVLIRIGYSTSLFKRATIEGLSRHLQNLIEIITSDSGILIGDIDILSMAERHQLLYELNDSYLESLQDKTIHQLFEEQVRKTPQRTALMFQGKELTYQELDKLANGLAQVLREKGVCRNVIVGILLDRSLEIVITMLGILKAGGTYLPIDINWPQARIDYVLQDSGSKLLVVADEFAFNGQLLSLAELDLYQLPGIQNPNYNQPGDMAYIIYTSGTTGNPKGVMVTHQNVISLMESAKVTFDFNSQDIWTMFHSPCFDFSVWEMYGALFYGAKLIIIPKWVAQHSIEFSKVLEQEQVTVLNQTPSALRSLINELESDPICDLSSVRYLILGGESLKPSMVTPWMKRYPQTQIINMYGITETTVFVTFKKLTEGEIKANISNIGRSLPSLKTYVFDQFMKLLPWGIPGELYVAGGGVSAGYLHKDELTSERFIANPYIKGEILYKTGDIVKLLVNNDLEYINRQDNQVQIRGFRIELGEIEHQILQLGVVKEVVVLVRGKKDQEGDQFLCAYFVAEAEILASELREALAKALPDYMIPSSFIQLDRIPITLNGKVDHPSLLALAVETEVEYVAPRNRTEEILVEIWREVLEREPIGINDNFFELGGHSLKATVVIGRIHKALKVELPLKELFRTPTISGISDYLCKVTVSPYAAITPTLKKDYYETSSAMKRMWLLQELNPESIGYNIPSVLIMDGELSWSRLEAAFSGLIARHETLRTAFVDIDGEVMQSIAADVDFNIAYGEAEATSIDTTIKAFIRPFALNQAPLLRARVVKTSATRHYLLLDMHHIIADGVSMAILTKEFMALYDGRHLKPPRLQYKDFAAWQNAYLKSEKMQKQENYWLEQFSGALPLLDFPLDYLRPAVRSFAGGVVEFQLNREITEQLNMLARETDTTLYMVLLSMTYILLAMYTEQYDIIIGSPIAGRSHADLEGIIGMFVNTLALRCYPKSGKTYETFLSEVKATALSAYENQDYPFESLVEKLNLGRDLSRNPLFDVMFVLQNMEVEQLAIEGLKFTEYKSGQVPAKFDLTFMATEADAEIAVSIMYSTGLFERETIKRMGEHFQELMEIIIADRTVEI